jgi:F-type H+-transporting ATPase subunit delta
MRGVSRISLAALVDQLRELTADADDATVRELGTDLFSVVHLLDAQPRLRRVLSDPALPADGRAELMRSLLTGRVSDLAGRVVEALVEETWSRPGDLVDAADQLAAEALFTVAERGDQLDDIEDALFRFGRILDREVTLRAALTDPSLATDRKLGILDELLSGKVGDETGTLIREVLLHPRGRTVERGLEEYARLAAARRDRLVAHVRTVVALTEEQMTRLAEALGAQLGHAVHLNIEIDPDIIGGISVRIGDELFDGTIATRIAQARRLMAS